MVSMCSTTKSSSAPSPLPCACSITSSTSTITPCPRRAIPTCAIVRWAWVSWDSRIACTGCACPSPPMPPSSSPTVPWKPPAITPIGLPASWRPNAAPTPASRVRCGIAAFCRKTPWQCWAKGRNSNGRHRWVGVGVQGFADCRHMMRGPFASDAAVEFSDRSMEAACYYAYWASSKLAAERGAYASFKGSLWDRGILPQDTLAMLREERGGYVEVDDSSTLDWDSLRAHIGQYGMRNSNCVAIAPTATISNILGVSPCNEPPYPTPRTEGAVEGK